MLSVPATLVAAAPAAAAPVALLPLRRASRRLLRLCLLLCSALPELLLLETCGAAAPRSESAPGQVSCGSLFSMLLLRRPHL